MDQFGVVECGQYDNMGIGPTFLQRPGGGDAIHARHANVHENDVGWRPCFIKLLDRSDGSLSITSGSYDLKIGLEFQQFPKPLTDKRLVVHDQDANTCRHASLLPFLRKRGVSLFYASLLAWLTTNEAEGAVGTGTRTVTR